MACSTTETTQPNTHFEIKCATFAVVFIKVSRLIEADSISFTEENGVHSMQICHNAQCEQKMQYKLANKREMFRVKRAVKGLLKTA